MSLLPSLTNTSFRLIAHPIACDAWALALVKFWNALMCSAVLGPITGRLIGITSALEVYLHIKYNSIQYTITLARTLSLLYVILLVLQTFTKGILTEDSHITIGVDFHNVTYLLRLPISEKLQQIRGIVRGFLRPIFIFPICLPLHKLIKISPMPSEVLGSSSENGIVDLKHLSSTNVSDVLLVFIM